MGGAPSPLRPAALLLLLLLAAALAELAAPGARAATPHGDAADRVADHDAGGGAAPRLRSSAGAEAEASPAGTNGARRVMAPAPAGTNGTRRRTAPAPATHSPTPSISPSCNTHAGMSTAECSALNQAWQSSQCGSFPVRPRSFQHTHRRDATDAGNQSKVQPAVWTGPGCPRPCAVRAEKRGENPRAACKRAGSAFTFDDGGCKLWSDCAIHCQRTCEAQPSCFWKWGSCHARAR